MTRPNNRKNDEMRSISMETGFTPYAEGSCLIKIGGTHVLCNASVETKVPPFLRGSGTGWVTAEYGMLPRSTHGRMQRKESAGSGRTQEIQRLIGRALRAVVDTTALGENQIRIDCDVIQADGGTRTASITGAFVALKLAEKWMIENKIIETPFIISSVSAVSCGILNSECILDLEYTEDSTAQADTNFVLTDTGGVVEVQGTAEETAFSRQQFNQLFDLAEKGCAELIKIQNKTIAKA